MCFMYVCMYVAQLRSEQLSYERGGVPLQQSLGAGKSIIRGRVTYIHLDILPIHKREYIYIHTYIYAGLQSVVTVTDNAADPHDNFSQSVNLTPDKTIGGCGWKSAAGRLVKAALVVSTYIHTYKHVFLFICMHTYISILILCISLRT